MKTPLIYYFFPLFILAIAYEIWMSKKRKRYVYLREDTIANFGVGLGGQVVHLLPYPFFIALFFQAYHGLAEIRQSWLGYEYLENSLKVWVIAILVDDFCYYWYHRISHHVRILWACHVVHHSSEQFNFSVAVRNGWFGAYYKLLFWLCMPILGFHPAMIVTCISINSIYQFFCHTQIRSSWEYLSPVLITPGLHAVHHAKNADCIDKNFAGIFSFYDRLFGTYKPYEIEEQLHFGVTIPPESHKVSEIITHEFRNLFKSLKQKNSLRDKLLELLRSPR